MFEISFPHPTTMIICVATYKVNLALFFQTAYGRNTKLQATGIEASPDKKS